MEEGDVEQWPVGLSHTTEFPDVSVNPESVDMMQTVGTEQIKQG